MTTAVRDTSSIAFMNLQDNKIHLGQMQEKVFQCIKNNPFICDREISEILGIAINSITPRRNELLEMKFIIDCGTKKYNGRSVHYWSIK